MDVVLDLLKMQLTSSEFLPRYLSWRWPEGRAVCLGKIMQGQCKNCLNAIQKKCGFF
jgi:hypothetical protein